MMTGTLPPSSAPLRISSPMIGTLLSAESIRFSRELVVVLQDEPEHVHQGQQQREHGEEPPVGQQHGQLAAASIPPMAAWP